MKHMFSLERLLLEVAIYLLIKLYFSNCSISLVGVDYKEDREGECGVGHAKNNLRTNCTILIKLFPSEQSLLQTFTLEPSSEIKFQDAQTVHFLEGQKLQTQIHWEEQGTCHNLGFRGGFNLKVSPVSSLDKRSSLMP